MSLALQEVEQPVGERPQREVPLDTGGHADALGLKDHRPVPAERAARSEDERRVRRAIEQLSEDYKRVLELRTWRRLPFAEIGREMDRSAGAAEKLWLRAEEIGGSRVLNYTLFAER